MKHPLAIPVRHDWPGMLWACAARLPERNRRMTLRALRLAAAVGLLAACRPMGAAPTPLPTAASVFTATSPQVDSPTLESPTRASTAPTPVAVSVPGQPTRSIFVEGNLAYLGVGPRLVILDISDPQHPSLVGKTAPLEGTDPLAGFVKAITPWDRYLILTTLTAPEWHGTGVPSGLYIVDRSDPSRPHVVGSYSSQAWWDVEVLDSYALVTTRHSFEGDGITVFDLAEPGPRQVTFLTVSGGADAIRLSGVLAYVTGPHGLSILDVSVPSSPIEIVYYQFPEGATSIELSDDVAFVAGPRFSILDLSDPTNVRLIGSRRESAQIVRVDLPYAYVFSPTMTPSVLILDISSPSVPLLVGVFQRPNLSPALARSGNALFIGDQRGGLTVVDVTDPTRPVEVGTWVLPE